MNLTDIITWTTDEIEVHFTNVALWEPAVRGICRPECLKRIQRLHDLQEVLTGIISCMIEEYEIDIIAQEKPACFLMILLDDDSTVLY